MKTKLNLLLMVLKDSRGDTGYRILLPFCSPGQIRPVIIKDHYVCMKRG